MRIRPPDEEILEREQEVRTLTEQIEEQVQALQAMTTQVARKEEAIQTLITQAAEREQNIQILSAQIADINHSIGWRIVTKVRQIREILAPVDSKRGHMLKMFLKGLRTWQVEGGKSFLGKVYRKRNSTEKRN